MVWLNISAFSSRARAFSAPYRCRSGRDSLHLHTSTTRASCIVLLTYHYCTGNTANDGEFRHQGEHALCWRAEAFVHSVFGVRLHCVLKVPFRRLCTFAWTRRIALVRIYLYSDIQYVQYVWYLISMILMWKWYLFWRCHSIPLHIRWCAHHWCHWCLMMYLSETAWRGSVLPILACLPFSYRDGRSCRCQKATRTRRSHARIAPRALPRTAIPHFSHTCRRACRHCCRTHLPTATAHCRAAATAWRYGACDTQRCTGWVAVDVLRVRSVDWFSSRRRDRRNQFGRDRLARVRDGAALVIISSFAVLMTSQFLPFGPIHAFIMLYKRVIFVHCLFCVVYSCYRVWYSIILILIF